MGASNSPLQQNNLAEILNSVNPQISSDPQSPNQTPNIIINNLNVVINGQEFIYQNNQVFNNNNSSQQPPQPPQQEVINKPQENVVLNNNIQLIINSELGQIKLQVNLLDKIDDIIQKYKNKLNKDNIAKIYLYTMDNIFLNPNSFLKDYYNVNNPIITAKFDYKLTSSINSVSFSENSKNKIKKEYQFQNQEIPHVQLEEAREIMKEKLRNGWIAVVVRSALLGIKLFYVKPNDKFKIIENEYKKLYPGKEWVFLFNGLKIDPDKTIKEQKIKWLSRVIVDEFSP